MKLPISWLNEYINFKKSDEEISENLTMIGNEVESIEKSGNIDGVIVGEIKKIIPHPNADKLKLTIVFDGNNEIQVVCGAPNIEEGQKIFLATPGTKLPLENGSTFEIKKSKIRGEISEGMICSEKELGLSDNHEGIMVLDNSFLIGDPLSKYFSETVFDIDVTPNRVDCLSIVGLARDLSAKFSTKLNFNYSNDFDIDNSKGIVEILDEKICPRYSGIILDSVNITDSPDWLKSKLISIGERPINNVVDITNYVMFEIGQPLHAFDLDKISGDKIFVRESNSKEKIITLDGEERELPSKSIVIADEKQSIGLAGIMGGGNSEIDNTTKTIFLESANFNPQYIRNTSKKLNLSTEASIRFERNLNPEITEFALSRAANLIIELAGGKSRGFMEDLYQNKSDNKSKISLKKDKIKSHLGLDLDDKKISNTLENLDFTFDFSTKESTWQVDKPFWRSDINISEDLHEEIARIIGYDDIPLSFLSGEIPKWEPNEQYDTKIFLQDILVGIGLTETISYSATSEKLLNLTPLISNLGKSIELDNPISNEHAYLRKSIIPSLLINASRNTHYWKKPIRLFETGSVFYMDQSKIIEKTMISGILAGTRNELNWNQEEGLVDYFDIKGIVEFILKKLNIKVEFTDYTDPLFDLHKSSKIFNKNINKDIGFIGEVSSKLLAELDFNSNNVVIFELDLDSLIKAKSPIVYEEFSTFPQAHRDLSLIVEKNVKFDDLNKIILSEKYAVESVIVDSYEGEGIPSNKKSISIRISYQSFDNTLSSKNLEKIEKNILSKLKKQLDAYIRE
ncbi:MAG: phenylalanine--tRNA ligase subunit beta [SAR202 cluster bacterium]|jgi:phenylalanyl-tRNA synthetase beta chain|nr:MAG: phenylalanine--tRNA ligase subunit beta [SAR202 cluster bacterium]KAA1298518.1 MAG: phenylalanine--tRNA ligase subunit beta [SAR202 cluster bacterium]|tara:strand:- start:1244 stop:3634 length:2391 start_codon:yes stop_codon:yes gene_type:complete